MTRSEREQRALIERLGFTIIAERQARGAHRLLTLRAPDGSEHRAIITSTACGPRALRNNEARLRRALRQS